MEINTEPQPNGKYIGPPLDEEPQPNIEEAHRFLKLLDPEAEYFTFQTFDDDKGRASKRFKDEPDPLARTFHDTFEAIADTLLDLNKNGACVSVCVNETNLEGVSSKDIETIRAVFADKDNGDFQRLPLKPTILVQSKNGQHAYWLLSEEIQNDRFKDLQKRIANQLDSDTSVNNVNKVMRLPGFIHQKIEDEVFVPTIIEANNVSYSLLDIEKAFPSIDKVDIKTNKPKKKWTLESLRKNVDSLPTQEGVRNSKCFGLVMRSLKSDIAVEDIRSLVHQYCDRTYRDHPEAHSFTYEEAEKIIDSASKKYSDDPDSFQENKEQSDSFSTGIEFRTTNKGVFCVEHTGDGIEEYWVCSPLEVVASTRDEDGENWGRLLRWNDDDGRKHTWAMAAEFLDGNNSYYRRQLLRKGLLIGSSKQSRDALNLYIQMQNPPLRRLCVTATGWYKDSFVLPDGPLPKTEADIVLQNSFEFEEDLQGKFKASGTLEDWQREIGKKCIGNSRLILTVAAAFAPPLLSLVNEGSGGIHVFGPTTSGKTTAVLVGGSAWGGDSDKGFVESWRATANGLEAIASVHNDSLLVLDEIDEIDPKELRKVVYMLANGFGKQRALRSGTGASRRKWRLLFLSTGERTLGEFLSSSDIKLQGGQEVRMIDVPAVVGEYGAFETIHDEPTSKVFADKLSRASKIYYGSPIRAFLSRLTIERDAAVVEVRKHIESFILLAQKQITSEISHEVERVISRFSLIAACGELATVYGVLPWSQGEATNGVLKCLMAWIDERGGTSRAEEEAIIDQVRGYLLKNDSRFIVNHESHGNKFRSSSQLAGAKKYEKVPDKFKVNYHTYDLDGHCEYLVFTHVFEKEVCRGYNVKRVANLLLERGFLVPDRNDDKPRARNEKIRGIGQARVYVISSRILNASKTEAV